MNSIELKVLKTLKKYFIFEFVEESYKGKVCGRIVSIKSREYPLDCVCSNLVLNEADFNLLKDIIK